ncbi:MAG: cupin domain-containing protein [Spirochaetaceae bacterium]|jgi:quercetin dioxygenase-like cupin family protein/DNA-binding XRE family transcriptional regulator|nr:cupin domain-containing protein [Spirochaetaceae bacterium]
MNEIVQRIKALREIADISADDLANELKFDPAEYAEWEEGKKEFPMGSLVEIATHFKVDISEILTGNSAKLSKYCLTRAGEAPMVNRRPMHTYWNLGFNFHGKKAEPFLVETSAKTADEPIALNNHPGQEFDYVLEGKLLVSIGGREVTLGPGDSIYYDSTEMHGMKAAGKDNVRFLAFVF